jgi:tRNA pseudouridine38-40 synthase
VAALLAGRHDMASFTVTDPTQGPTVRTLYSVDVEVGPGGATFRFLGDGFLRYQVRRMVGAALEAGWGRRSVAELGRLLDDPHPGAGLWTAPAGGLTLERVVYRPLAGGGPAAAG